MSGRRLTHLTGLLVASAVFFPFGAHAGPIDLGRAADFTVLATSGLAAGGSVNIGPQSVITGNVGGQQSVTLGPQILIEGSVTTPALLAGGGVTTGSVTRNFDVGISEDVRAASQEAASLSGISLGDISDSRTLDARGRAVFSIGDLTLESGEFLTLTGAAGDEVILNVAGSFSFAANSGILLGDDLLASDLLVNVLGLGAVNLNRGLFAGTLLAADRTLLIGAGASFDEARFLTNNLIVGPQTRISGISGDGPIAGFEATAVPEPPASVLFLLGLMSLVWADRRWRRAPSAS
ncbi:collagen-binding domain-containing protein [Pelagibius sp. Alg239-R121]|uniref:collagen-binding domain-containing protein n=1 Tax=Pelagibius sp. Alg239-R121 TaxID=2993448 RepID=UPI0024A617E0|nr:collagen-binding domain-containing protein [Pelagibius sp. Alg239-R121]